MPKTLKSAEERFWRRVVKTDTCWLWNGLKFGNKYGMLKDDNGRQIGAHRFSYMLHKGPIPRGKFICHGCDVRNCVNPDHLRAGDHEDNNQDKMDRQRHVRPSIKVARAVSQLRQHDNGRALSLDRRKQMAEEYQAGKFTQIELAARYSVSQATVSATIRGKRNMGSGDNDASKTRSGHYKQKLTQEQRDAIKAEYLAGGVTQKALAEKYGCDQTYVSMLIR